MSAPAVQEPTVQGRGTVAVGYDGSETAQQAVAWAVTYAAAAGLNLRVVHAWVWPVFTKNLGPVKGVAGSGLRHSAETILAEGVELARSAAAAASGTGGADVDRSAGLSAGEAGPPAGRGRRSAPVPYRRQRPKRYRNTHCRVQRPGQTRGGGRHRNRASRARAARSRRDARLLVVSSRGLGGVLGQLAGSVCLDLAGSAPCPLMVVRRLRSRGRPRRRGHRRLVPEPRDAGRRRPAGGGAWAPLRIVHVDQSAADQGKHGRHAPLRGQELLDRAIDEARNQPHGLAISVDLREGHAASKNCWRPPADADVLVIGTHNPAGGPGNTVTAVLNKARCNVLITR